jgi:hypothetical protein
MPVSLEILKLLKVFKNIYRFETEIWHIPDQDCHAEVRQKTLNSLSLEATAKNTSRLCTTPVMVSSQGIACSHGLGTAQISHIRTDVIMTGILFCIEN